MKNKTNRTKLPKLLLSRFIIFILIFSTCFSACKKDNDDLNKNGGNSNTSSTSGNSSAGYNTQVKPKVAFTYNVNGMGVMFKSISQNADSYFWDFGDNISSLDISPIHMYKKSKTYTVMHVAINAAGTDTIRKSIVIK